jgi:hypothetical protein
LRRRRRTEDQPDQNQIRPDRADRVCAPLAMAKRRPWRRSGRPLHCRAAEEHPIFQRRR